MPKHLMYDSVAEAENRLMGTIVTYEGRPVKVMAVDSYEDGAIRLHIAEFPYDKRAITKRADSPHFRRFQTPPLGYCNYFEGRNLHAFWCERVSARTRRQGLCDETFSATTNDGRRQTLGRIGTSDAFREMIAGEYPVYAEALARLVPNSTIAVSRDFAFEQAPDGFTKLVWRREPIALVVRDSVMLRNDRQHLVETIADCPNLPNRVEIL